MKKPIRIQRKRVKGWKLPPNTVCVTRGTRFGNPFRVGGYFMMGDPGGSHHAAFRMAFCECNPAPDLLDPRATLIKDNAMAVEWFEKLCATGYFKPDELAELRGKNLACFCKEGAVCHADVLLRLANP